MELNKQKQSYFEKEYNINIIYLIKLMMKSIYQ